MSSGRSCQVKGWDTGPVMQTVGSLRVQRRDLRMSLVREGFLEEVGLSPL